MNPNPELTRRLMIAYKWLAIVMALAILVQAVLASQGLFDNHPGLITGHGQFGNAVFLLAVVQVVLAFNLSNAMGSTTKDSGYFPRTVVYLNALQALLVLIQIFIGYRTRDDVSAVAWHIPNGVLLMAIATTLAVLAWFRPGATER